MDTLSLVSKYLNVMEDILDDGDSLKARKLKVGKCKEELELFEALDHKSVIANEGSHRVVVFKKAPPRAYSNPFTRFSLPCDVDGQGAWDAKLDMADSFNYMTEERFDQFGFVRVDYGKYGRKMVREVRVEIHGFTFLVDFVVITYGNKGEPSVKFSRDFLVTSKSKVDFGIGKMRIDLTILEEMKDIDIMLDKLVENLEEVEIPPISAIAPPSPIYHPLTQKQKEKVKEALDRKYKELEESKPILEVLENYMTYQKKLDEVLMEERVNGTIKMNALADTGASVSVLPYCLFMNLGLIDPKPYNFNLTMADNTQAKVIGEVKNVRFQIEYEAYLVDFLILYIPVDKELPLLFGRPFFRTCGAVIDMGHGTLCIDDGVIRHTYFPKPRAKAYLDNFTQEEEDDWLSCFEVGRDEDGNPKYRPVAPSFLDIEDDMERALAMEAYFNPFKNIIIFKKLIDFLGSLPVQLKNTDWGNEGYRTYKKVEVKNANLKWKELPSTERHAYCERLSRLQGKGFGIPRVPSWTLFYDYNIEENLKNKMKYEYLHDDEDVFVDYSWERALSIYEMLYGVEKMLTLPEFVVLLGLYEEDELNHGLFTIHFTKLEVDDKLFNHEVFWQKIRKLTSTNPRTSLIKEPLMRIVHKLLVGSLVHRAGLKENSLVCGGHYVTKIAHSLGYLNEEEEPPNVPPYPYPYVPYPHPYTYYPDTGSPSFGGDHYGEHGDGYHTGSIVPGSGYEIGGSSAFHGEDFDPIVHLKDCVESDDDEMRD
ncbi:putative ribonuclease H-like domain-containing protein [Tanacetum coccineum]